MLILNKVDAIDMLSDLAPENSPLADLLYEIQDRGMADALDWVVANEYPNGVEVEELEDFFWNEQDFIRRELGINKDAEADDEDEDEEEEEN